MTAGPGIRRQPRRPSFSRDRIEYRLLVMLAFLMCLVLALSRRISGLAGRASRTDRAGGESIVAEARSSAHAAVGYAFMV